MKIIVKAKTKAGENKVERLNQSSLDLKNFKNELAIYKVWVKEAPVDGKANEAIKKALAEYFNITPARVTLITGQTAKQKIFEIN